MVGWSISTLMNARSEGCSARLLSLNLVQTAYFDMGLGFAI